MKRKNLNPEYEEETKMEETHPLTNIIERYCDEYENTLRENHLDLPNIAFHRTYGLSIQSPEIWNVLGSVKNIVDSFSEAHKIVIIFSSTVAYRKIHHLIEDRVQYLSWHEIFTGMHIVQQDVRYIQKSKQMLGEADLVFFLNPPALPEVLDQVKGQTSGALIVLSGGDLNV